MDFLLHKRLGKVFEKADEARNAEVARLDALLKYHGVEPRVKSTRQRTPTRVKKQKSGGRTVGSSGIVAQLLMKTTGYRVMEAAVAVAVAVPPRLRHLPRRKQRKPSRKHLIPSTRASSPKRRRKENR